MKKTLFLFGLLLLTSVAAFAIPVTYSTNSSQLCVGASGCGILTQTIGGVIITFDSIDSSTVDANPLTFSSFGALQISCVGGGTACTNQSLTGLNLYITIVQTLPTGGNGSIPVGVITGTIAGNSSDATITWAIPNTVLIGLISYAVQNNPLVLVPPTVNNGRTTVQAVITDVTVPEPSTYMLISGTLVGLGFLRRRMRRS